jgi:hypothetical protein
MRRAAVLLVAAAFGVAGCGGDEDETGSGEAVTVELEEQNASGQSGTATLTPAGDSTTVLIELENGTSEPQPAHIHPGSCADLDPQPEHGLSNVVDGESETTVRVPLSALTMGSLAINVHNSTADVDTYVACGDVGGKTGASGPDDGGYGY